MSGRIGKVRMKDTGFEFRVIQGVVDPETDNGARLLRAARSIGCDHDLVGYLVIGLTRGGGYRCGYRWHDEESPIPRTLMPSYLAEVVRRELVTECVAEDVFDQKFEWVE